MREYIDYLLVGGGLASASAAETLRKIGAEGRIAIISSESHLPYHRPPLTKKFLLENYDINRLYINKAEFYKQQKIELILSTTVESLEAGNKIIKTDRGIEYNYGKLLIATGTCIRTLDTEGADLKGVHYLRTIDDAESIKNSLKSSKKTVVLGSSFISMELASVFAESGIDTVVIAEENLVFSKLHSPEISEFFKEYYSKKGVKFIFGDTITKINGKLKVKSVETRNGLKFNCDILAIGIGVTPNIGFLKGSGIKIQDGVLVDSYMETNIEGIYAVGDVANSYDPIFKHHRRIEHWDNAIKQGRVAAKNMAGRRTQFRQVSYFFSDVFDLTFNFIGCPNYVDERIVRGSIKDKSFSVLYLKDNVLKAAFMLGRSNTEQNTLGSLIENGVVLGDYKENLTDESFDLSRIPLQNVLLLQGGGALGAFECGVVKAMEEKKIYPDIIFGISIGAFNAAIIAGNPKNAATRLEQFWREISVNTPYFPKEYTRRMVSSMYSMMFGSPKFFTPRWFNQILHPCELPFNWTSFYDPSPVKKLLAEYIDFEGLKASPVRLLVSAVNVETAEFETFDSYVDDITPDHIIASGSLPPSLPWTTINGNHYWDGGIVSNSPLNAYMEKFGLSGKKIFLVNLYQKENRLPENVLDVISRKDEIFYSEKIRNEVRLVEEIDSYRKLIRELTELLGPAEQKKIRSRPLYIESMNQIGPISITRFERENEKAEPASKDYDFSRKSIILNIEKGYLTAKKLLEKNSGKTTCSKKAKNN